MSYHSQPCNVKLALILLLTFVIWSNVKGQDITQFPYLENFESDAFVDSWDIEEIQHWRRYYSDIFSASWVVDSSYLINERGPSSGYNSKRFLRVEHNYSTSDIGYDYSNKIYDPYPIVTSPSFSFENIKSAKVSFRYHLWQGASSLSWLKVELMINNNGEYIEVFYDASNHFDVWKIATINLDNYINGSNEITKIKFRFTAYNHSDFTNERNTISIDAFEIKDIIYQDEPIVDATNWIEVDSTGIALTNRHMAVMSNTVDPNHELWVNGSLKASEVLIAVDSIPDYVFKKDYPLKSLEEIETYIQSNHHLPDIPSEAEYDARDGVAIGELNMLLLRKIEEITLHMIKMNKEIELLKSQKGEKNQQPKSHD